MRDFMHERRKSPRQLAFPERRGNLPAERQALGGRNPFRVVQGYVLALDELQETLPVAANVALDFGQCGEASMKRCSVVRPCRRFYPTSRGRCAAATDRRSACGTGQSEPCRPA